MTSTGPALGGTSVRGKPESDPSGLRSSLRERFGLDGGTPSVDEVRRRYGLDSVAGVSLRGNARAAAGRFDARASGKPFARGAARDSEAVGVGSIPRGGSPGILPPPRRDARGGGAPTPTVPVPSLPGGGDLVPLPPVHHSHPWSHTSSGWGGPWWCWGGWGWSPWSFTVSWGGGVRWTPLSYTTVPACSYYYTSCYEPVGYWCSPAWRLPFRPLSYCSPWWYRTRVVRTGWIGVYGPSAYWFSSDVGFRECRSPRTVGVWVEAAAPTDLAAALHPVELRFCEGWTLLRGGRWQEAAELLYSVSLEAEESAVTHWLLGLAVAGTGDLELGALAIERALRLEPRWLEQVWDETRHLGTTGGPHLHALCTERLSESPRDASALAVWGSLALLGRETDALSRLRGEIAEALLDDPEAPLLAEILSSTRRRAEGGEAPAGGPTPPGASDWLLDPSCDEIPSLLLTPHGS